MIFKSIEIDAFGKHADFRATDLDSSPVVVVLGANESGKSTFFEFLVTMLYGFDPPDVDRHPMAPWDGRRPGGQATVRMEEGIEYTIRRELRSSPEGWLNGPGGREPIGNQPVPWIGRVDQQVYRRLFALSADETGAIAQSSWRGIEERLVGGGSGFAEIRSAYRAVDDLVKNADSRWRPDRRGRPATREITDRLASLKRERAKAMRRSDRVVELRQEEETRRDRIDELRNQLVRLRTRLERADVLLPILRRAADIERLRGAARDLLPVDDLPENARLDLAEVESHVARRRDRVDSLLEEIKRQKQRSSVADDEQALLSREEDIRRVLRRVLLDVAERQQLEAARARYQEEEARFRRESVRLWNETPPRSVREGLRDLDVPELRRRASAESGLRSSLGIGLGVLILALAVGAFTGVGGGVLGAVMLGGGVLLALVEGGTRQRRREALGELLAPLRVSHHALSQPVDQLVADVESMRESVRRVADLGDEIETYDRGLEELATIGRSLGAESELRPRDWQRRLDAAVTARARAEEARVAAAGMRGGLMRAHEELSEALEVYERLRDRLVALDEQGGDPHEGLRLLERARRLRTDAEAREGALDVEIPDWRERKDEADSLSHEGRVLSLSTEERVRLKSEIEDIGRQLEEESEQVGKAAEERAGLERLASVSDLDGEIQALEEERNRLRQERDRLMLQVSIIREAEARQRGRFRPTVLSRASEFLARISRGRYREMGIQDDEGRPTLFVRGPQGEVVFTADYPLSRGARDQIHLCFRLALVEQFDGEEPLPLVLDEIFSSWDPNRVARGCRLLRMIANKRQVFFMTCRPFIARLLEQEADALVLRTSAMSQSSPTDAPSEQGAIQP